MCLCLLICIQFALKPNYLLVNSLFAFAGLFSYFYLGLILFFIAHFLVDSCLSLFKFPFISFFNLQEDKRQFWFLHKHNSTRLYNSLHNSKKKNSPTCVAAMKLNVKIQCPRFFRLLCLCGNLQHVHVSKLAWRATVSLGCAEGGG